MDTTVVSIFGPPGTGKTTTLCKRYVTPAISKGTVAVVSFSTAAAKQLSESVFPSPTSFVGTIHALCFRTLGLRRSEVVDERMLADEMGYDEEQVKSVLNLHSFARSTNQTLKQCYGSYVTNDPYALPLEDAYEFVIDYNRYKHTKGMTDFTDMLEICLERGNVPHFDRVFVDEAQDLTPLQWKVVDAMTPAFLTMAGDDDQAVYAFFGADPHHMRKIARHTVVLDQSHRVPHLMHTLANSISARIVDRQHKNWKPRAAEGKIIERSDPVATIYENRHVVDAVALFRDRFILRDVADELTGIGIPWHSHAAYSPYKNRWVDTVRAVREGVINDPLNEYLQRNLDERSRGRTIKRDAIPESFLDMERVPYMVMGVLDQEQAPLLELSTVHGFKGREANTVFLTLDCTPRVEMAAYIKEILDDELRVWYTAVTRAKETLYLIGQNEFITT